VRLVGTRCARPWKSDGRDEADRSLALPEADSGHRAESGERRAEGGGRRALQLLLKSSCDCHCKYETPLAPVNTFRQIVAGKPDSPCEGREMLSQQERRFVRFLCMKTMSQPDARRVVPSPPSGERVRVRGRAEAAGQSYELSYPQAKEGRAALTSEAARTAARPSPSPQPSPPVGEREKKSVRVEHLGMHRTRTEDARDFARHLRQESTPSEKWLWRLLRDRHFSEFKFRRQYACGPYFLDFHCTLAQLAVELDGGHHGFPDERARDEERNRFLATKDIKVLRFWNHQLRGELESVRFEIWYALMERTGRTAELAQFKARPVEAYGQNLSAEGRGRAGVDADAIREWVRPAPSPRPSPPMGEREKAGRGNLADRRVTAFATPAAVPSPPSGERARVRGQAGPMTQHTFKRL